MVLPWRAELCDPSGNVRGLARLRYATTGQFGVISVAGFRNGNNAVTISLTQLDEVAVREQRRVARYVPANDRRRDSSTRSNAALPPDICALPIALSRRGKPIHLDLSAECSVKPIRVIRGSLSIGLPEPL